MFHRHLRAYVQVFSFTSLYTRVNVKTEALQEITPHPNQDNHVTLFDVLNVQTFYLSKPVEVPNKINPSLLALLQSVIQHKSRVTFVTSHESRKIID